MRSLPRSARIVRGLWRALACALAETLVVLVVMLLNPFGVDEAAHEHSRELWKIVQAESYKPPPGLKGHVPGLDDITVVYLDDTGAGRTASQLSLREHEDMLSEIATSNAGGRPVAIFIDISFANAAPRLGDPHAVLPPMTDGERAQQINECGSARAHPVSGQQAPDRFGCYVAKVAKITNYAAWRDRPDCRRGPLAKLACIVGSGGIPVIFATLDEIEAPSVGGGWTASEQALNQVAIMAPGFVSTKGYELAARGVGGGQIALSPVAVLYAAYCWSTPADLADSGCQIPPLPRQTFPTSDDESIWLTYLRNLTWSPKSARLAETSFDRPVDLGWGIGSQDSFWDMIDRQHGGTLKSRCRVADPGPGGLLLNLIRAAAPTFSSDRPQPSCLYTHGLPYTDFDGDGFSQQDWVQAVNHKLILIGGRYERSGDWLPGLDRAVPGVYYHAMVLDNIIKNGNTYFSPPSELIRGSAINPEALLTLLAIAIITFLAACAVLTLNELGMPPGGVSGGLAAAGWLVATPRRWAWRFAIALTPTVAILSALCLAAAGPHASLIYGINVVAILVVLGAGAVRLIVLALRPLAQPYHHVFRFFEISEARWLGPDLDEPPPKVKPRRSAKSRTFPKPVEKQDV